MPDYGTFARFADYKPPTQSAQVVRMPDGSIVMTGQQPRQSPSFFDRLRGAASRFLPTGGSRTTEPQMPWWIAQPSNEAQQVAAPTNQAPGGKVDPWKEIAKEAAHEEATASQLGAFSKAVMNSPELIEGKWGFRR